ncbi:MAG: hypothetical protein ACRC8A_08070 [Microcoleaceae cyanobacterium]
MVNFTSDSDREHLERLYLGEGYSTALNNTQSQFKTLCNRFCMWLTATNRLRVWPSTDSNGMPLWNAYDPITGDSISDLSESEMRAWLEQRIR